MEMTINIKTDEYIIKTARANKAISSLIIPLPNKWVGKEMLILPILDDDLIRIKKIKDRYLINIFTLEMFHKTVKPQNRKRKKSKRSK